MLTSSGVVIVVGKNVGKNVSAALYMLHVGACKEVWLGCGCSHATQKWYKIVQPKE